MAKTTVTQLLHELRPHALWETLKDVVAHVFRVSPAVTVAVLFALIFFGVAIVRRLKRRTPLPADTRLLVFNVRTRTIEEVDAIRGEPLAHHTVTVIITPESGVPLRIDAPLLVDADGSPKVPIIANFQGRFLLVHMYFHSRPLQRELNAGSYQVAVYDNQFAVELKPATWTVVR